MALKTLSTFLSPLSLPNNPSNFRPSAAKRSLIICRVSQPEKSPLSEDDSPPALGTGAAAPTPGDRFLERNRSVEAAKLALKERKKAKRKVERAFKLSNAVACCYGCGAPLQTSELDAPGFVEPETYALKKKHHQLKSVLCGRCKLLSHGHMITAVGGNGGYNGGKQFVQAEELREKLSHLRYEKALIVKLVDIVDFNGSFLARIRDLAGANPIIFVITKVDLLPKGTDLNCVGDWVVEAVTKKKLNVLSVHLTSSKSLVGITGVASDIQKEKKGRDVYILGSANVGKSAFINALLKLMAEKDPAAAAARKYRPIQSAVPGTTLGPIQINAFLNGGKLYDTPGVHLHHRQAAVVHAEDLPSLAPQSRLRGQSFPCTTTGNDNDMSNGLNGFTLFWGGLVRVDVVKALPETCLTFYGPKSIPIHMVPIEEADEFYQREIGVLLTPPTGKERANEWRGLEIVRQLQIPFEDTERLASDVAISGLGWIAVEPKSKFFRNSDSSSENNNNNNASGEVHLIVHVPRPVEVFVRDSLPVGKSGAEMYQYQELTDAEAESRPKWNF